MPFNIDDKKFGVAKAEVVGDEIQVVVTPEQMAMLNKVLEEDGYEGGVNDGLFKQAGIAFKKFAKAEKALGEPMEEPPTNNWGHVQAAEMLVHYPRNANQEGRYDVDQTVNPGWLKFHNVKDLLARFFVTVHANNGKVKNWRSLCIGITSMDYENGQMPMFDYDGKNIKTRVKKDVKLLQKKFGLGDATIYETRRGLHVYFFSDTVELEQYSEMLDSVGCCKGFKASFEKKGYAVLRVSAKYTEFDILPYKVIVSPNRVRTRPGRKAVIIQELLRLGQECGTHLAALYPQWAGFQEDISPWRAASAKKATRRVKKISKEEYIKKVGEKKKSIKENMYKVAYSTPMFNNEVKYSNTAATTWTTTTTTTTGNW